MAMKRACIVLAAAGATGACVVAGLAPYPAAAVMAGTGVAAVGVNRSLTGDCWGWCHAGSVCDRDSGLCVRQPCGGECQYDELCENGRCVLRRRERTASVPDTDGATSLQEHDHRDEDAAR